ncbi:hypothetical protein Q4506_06620 [Colwellia sp. 4_MG-2023]|jgi:hypothetical protein|uniref:hypothetical protein n=1 Tax=unclassified Colwellia TaxID=196834 RepID=UPI001C08943A|nr:MULTISPECIES: hypothetical protein [unclassified Colwellia]MBU2925843.1 hypothetical protein [Colwellia sp. C2M11]MDO6489124.1 hypothetical protein [Colwellia sp. 6_MG-2023]MDO6508205.1 hypothetical protein [Colwellia sp. 5_MG-2023]MDO6555346.1 hypothetical protein [Colwellia sp. 4_MG-2023]MDO6652760.1 hypothetical protein [Colwellia sp. 3_MG-2023]
MKSKPSSKYYLSASFIMLLGLIYNVIEQDFWGSGVFLISSIIFLTLGIIEKRTLKK